MSNPRMLFVCTYSGVRSLIAQHFAEQLAPGKVDVFSAGFEPGHVPAVAIDVMREVGVNLPADGPVTVFERYRKGELFDHVVVLCGLGSSEQCQTLKKAVEGLYGKTANVHLLSIPAFMDPARMEAVPEGEAREIRDLIGGEVSAFLSGLGVAAAG